MSVESIGSGFTGLANKATSGNFSVRDAGDFFPGLKLGQVLKGKVLRQYEGNRYLVSFSGQEKVVDSAVPLHTNEIIHGKVIGLGDRVEMQRVYEQAPEASPAPAPNAPTAFFSNKHEQLLNGLLDQFRGRMNADDRALLLREVRQAADGPTMALAGVALNKLGISQNADLLRSLYEKLEANPARAGLFAVNENTNAPELSAAVSTLGNEAIQSLTVGLAASLVDVPEKLLVDPKSTNETLPANFSVAGNPASTENLSLGDMLSDNPQDGKFDLARWLLNVQTDSSVAHRVGTIPIAYGDRLIEVDVAMFEQRRQAVRDGLQHRQLVFVLNTETLGRVEIAAAMADQHIRIRVTSDSLHASETIASHMSELRQVLSDYGWQPDEVVYEVRDAAQGQNVARTVVEHVVRQDSLSFLI